MNEIQRSCTTKKMLIHCVTAKKIVDIYRATAAPIKGFWDTCAALIQSALADGQEYDHKGVLLFRKEEIVLPSGMSIKYPNLRRVPDEVPDSKGRKRMQWVYGEDKTRLYGPKVVNNVTQGLARVVMTDGMTRVGARLPLVSTVHDELLSIVPEAQGAQALAWMIRRMTEEPKYMLGIPLAADGGFHRGYGLAKG